MIKNESKIKNKVNDNSDLLVSIIVITYNSSKYVLETLESAKAQTYQNIELIVSDDCSTDNTVEICNDWLDANKERFTSIKLITFKVNTGVAPNCNRGVKASSAKWIKIIAGDDILLENCIKDNIDFIKTRKDCVWVCSKLFIKSNGSLSQENHTRLIRALKINTQNEYIKQMLILDFISSPSVFISKDIIVKNGFFNEQIPMMEDTPFWLKLFQNGYSLDFLNKETVIYRYSESSISQYANKVINSSFYNSKKIYFNTIARKLLLNKHMFLELISNYIWFKYYEIAIEKGGSNNMSFFERSIRFLSPRWWQNHFPLMRIIRNFLNKVVK